MQNINATESNSSLHMFANPQTSAKLPVVAQPDEKKERDWLLDPVNLYLRGMAQRREQMKKL